MPSTGRREVKLLTYGDVQKGIQGSAVEYSHLLSSHTHTDRKSGKEKRGRQINPWMWWGGLTAPGSGVGINLPGDREEWQALN